MLDESFILEYSSHILNDMVESKRAIFEGQLRKYVISSTFLRAEGIIRFHLYQDHFLEAVAKWPWLLCSDLGAHLELHSYGYDLHDKWIKAP